MRITVLGCSGGVGPDLRTTTLLVDGTSLIDAGTGVGDLSLQQMRGIREVFLTHAHLDHVCGLAFMADNLFDPEAPPLRVCAIEATLAALRRHLFNWHIWPDFFCLPDAERPLLREQVLAERQTGALAGGGRITTFPVLHSVPAIGVALEDVAGGCFAFSGDTWDCDSLWEALNALPRLDQLMIEIAFADEDAPLGALSRHFTPSLLGQALRRLRHRPQLLLTHHKPGCEDAIAAQCRSALAGWNYRHLRRGDVIVV